MQNERKFKKTEYVDIVHMYRSEQTRMAHTMIENI